MNSIENLEASEITPLTMAILPQFDERGNLLSNIITETGEHLVPITPIKVIQNACSFFASSLQGRLEGTKSVSRFTHKAPIAIDPASGIYFFPTRSPRNKDCAWLSHSHIQSIDPDKNKKTIVSFRNGLQIFFEESYGSMTNQLQRTAQFRYMLERRLDSIRRITNKEKVK